MDKYFAMVTVYLKEISAHAVARALLVSLVAIVQPTSTIAPQRFTTKMAYHITPNHVKMVPRVLI